MPNDTTLDAIVDNMTTATARTLAELDATMLHVAAHADNAAKLSTLVPGEDDATTHRALSEMYDRTRDRHVLSLAKLTQTYGEMMNKRELAAADVAPLLPEMRKALDRADAAQKRSATHRSAENVAAAKANKAK
jgi:hypothetical protein